MHRLQIAMLLAAVASSLMLASPYTVGGEPSYPTLTMPDPLPDNNNPGFKPIFDGKTLQGWKGDPAYWRVGNGTIIGETLQEIPSSIYLIWQDGRPGDFELKLDYRISDMGNSGVQYRSQEMPDVRGALRGYQADIDGAGWGRTFYEQFEPARKANLRRVTGQNFDEWGRTFLALPGQLTYIGNDAKRVVATLGDTDILANGLTNGWNTMHLIVRGNQMTHIVNNHVMSIVIDDDIEHRRMEGILALQIHGGDPMKVEFRKILLKKL